MALSDGKFELGGMPAGANAGPLQRVNFFKGIPTWYFCQVVLWRPGAPRPNKHNCSDK